MMIYSTVTRFRKSNLPSLIGNYISCKHILGFESKNCNLPNSTSSHYVRDPWDIPVYIRQSLTLVSLVHATWCKLFYLICLTFMILPLFLTVGRVRGVKSVTSHKFILLLEIKITKLN